MPRPSKRKRQRKRNDDEETASSLRAQLPFIRGAIARDCFQARIHRQELAESQSPRPAEPASPQPRPAKAAAAKPPAKNKVTKKVREARQAAGRAGARARWRHVLEWHRDLEQLRDGFRRENWKLCALHLEVRYLALWRSGGKALSQAADDELNGLADRLRPQLTRRMTPDFIGQLARVRNPDWHLPLLNIRWTMNKRRKGLPRLLRVTAAEERELEKMKQERKPQPQPSPSAVKRGERRKQLELALDVLRKRGDARPSLRTIQAELLRRTKHSVSTRTIALDRKKRG